jgi:hypothetical protein
MGKKIVFMPIIAPLVESRQICLSLSVFLSLHFTLVFLGLPSWQCPIRWALHVPCPGCGLSRAIKALAEGNWQAALTIHLFAPITVAALLLIAGACFLPQVYRLSLARYLRMKEQQTGISVILLLSFIFYWLTRLLFFPEILYQLVM